MNTEMKRRRRRHMCEPELVKDSAVFVRIPVGEIRVSLQEEETCRENVAALAASIARHGLLQPVVVQKQEHNGGYRIVLGTRRLEACRLLGIKEIDAILIEMDAAEEAACRLEEDEVRRGLSGWQRFELVERIGKEAIEEAYALNRRMLGRLHGLSSLGQKTKCIIQRAGLSLEQAEPLLQIHNPDRQVEAALIIAERGLTPDQAKRLVCGPRHSVRTDLEHGSGRRRAVRDAMEEISCLAGRLERQGMQASVSVHSQEKGLCIQLIISKS